MDVKCLLENRDKIKYFLQEKKNIEIEGWLVLIDCQLFLLEENFCEPYTESKKIKISDPTIAFSIHDTIMPLGGGKSFVFHRGRAKGFLDDLNGLEIVVKELLIEGDEKRFVPVSLNREDIEKARGKYGDFLIKREGIVSDDWIDYY